MKNHLLACLLLGLTTAAFARTEYTFTEPFDSTHPLRVDGVVSLDNVNGNVEIRTWDRAEIRIEGEKSAATEEELKLIDMAVDPQPDHATIKVKLPRRNGWWHGSTIRAAVRITLTVPAGVRLDEIRTVNGNVSIDGVRGAVHAASVNGRVKASVAGDADLATVNGGIEANVGTLGADNRVALRCVNGGITLSVPPNASARLDATTVNGGINCDFPVTVSGHITGRSVHGTIGAGAAEIKASSVNGGIRIRKA